MSLNATLSAPPALIRQPLISIVESDPASRASLRHLVEKIGRSIEHESVESLLAHEGERLSLACVSLAGSAGLEQLGRLRARHPALPIIVVTREPSVDWAIDAMRSGASDCIVQPSEAKRIATALNRNLLHPRGGTRAPQDWPIVGDSEPMVELRRHLERVADSDVVVCLRGETGTGKELVTRAMHDHSSRRRGPFVAVNCAAVPQELQESELFGHERGAFTGAVAAHRGRIEQANNGTLFLDELGEMNLAMQAVLLRVLQERKLQRIGGTVEVPVNIRVICATHRDLEAEVAAGRFRQDLYFRLAVYRIDLPPLRHRREDLPALTRHFLEKATPAGQRAPLLSAGALSMLQGYSWPGNVRELQNVMMSAALASDGLEIEAADLPAWIAYAPGRTVGNSFPPAPVEDDPMLSFREIERRAIVRAVKMAGGNVERAAKVLGLSRSTLYRRMGALVLDTSAKP